MVIGRIAVNISKGLIWDGLVKRLSDFYERLKTEKTQDLEKRVRQYRLRDEEAGIDHTVEELIKEYRLLEDKLTQWQKTAVDYSRKYLGYATNLVNKIHQIEDKGLEAYAFLEKIGKYLSKVVHYLPGRIGKAVYAVDVARGFIGGLGDVSKKAQEVMYIAERLNDGLIPYIIASRLRNAVRELKNLPPVGLEKMLGTAKDKIISVPGKIVEYSSRFRTKKSIYPLDFSFEAAPLYGVV